MAVKRIYVVTEKSEAGDKKHLVNAVSPAAAVKCCVQYRYSASSASAAETAQILMAGGKVIETEAEAA